MVTFEMANGKKIVIKVYPGCAPITAKNFLYLASEGFYNGTIFHRVIPDFIIQGGCPNGDGWGNPGWKIKGEFKHNLVDNHLVHLRGAVGMARESHDPDSAGSQFYIVLKRNRNIDYHYCIFGEVTEGMDVVDEIAGVETDANNRPIEEQRIVKTTLDPDEEVFAYKPEVIEINPPAHAPSDKTQA
ncbi:MAG: peptidylprolyl isomerase [Firmicutes bacterium]|nr:peptidylprolyl isomerase [Bacillota bacterium]